MTLEIALQRAAQAWCAPETSCLEMDTRLGHAFAEILRRELAPLEDQLEIAWGIIANAGGGDWDKEHPDWREAAARWRDEYHKLPVEQRHRAQLETP